MNVSDLMTPQPIIILSKASILEALHQMRDTGCHHLPVISAEKHLIGVLSFHDCQRVLGDALRNGMHPADPALAASLTVARAMTAAPIVIEPDAPAHQAAYLMLEYFIGCLPVMRGETLVGIVTRSDLLMAFMNMSQNSVHQRCG